MHWSKKYAACVAIAWVLTSMNALAQTILPTSAEPVPCVTNVEFSGVLFGGYYNTILAPPHFESISISDFDGTVYADRTVSNGKTTVFGDVNFGQNILIWSQNPQGSENKSTIQFKDIEDNVIQTCFIEVIEFDPAEHDASSMSLGFCEFNQTSGVSRVSLGAMMGFELPEKYREGATSPANVLNHRPLSGARQVQLIGNATGLATFIWLGEDKGSGPLRGVCPILVSDRQ